MVKWCFVLLLCFLACPLVSHSSDECQPLHAVCGDRVKDNEAHDCCEELTCHKGYCKKFLQIEETCGPNYPSCEPTLVCRNGKCQPQK